MTPEERRELIYTLGQIVEGARLMIDAHLTQLRRKQLDDENRDPLVFSLARVDGTLCDAQQGLQAIAKWEAE